MKSLKNINKKNLQKIKKNRAKIWHEKMQWGWNLKNNDPKKKTNAIKIIMTKLERLKNHRL